MIRTAKLLLLATVISLSAAYASSQPLLATAGLLPMAAGLQGYGQGQLITCSSDDGKRNYCNADTRRGVRLSRQISGSACIATQTWGYDNRGIWVDRGCRAEFVVNGGGYSGGGGGGQGQTVTCSSDNGRRNYCQVNGDPRRLNLTRQISGTPCVQNQTWGVDNRGLWVDRGCRAEFSFTGGGGGGGGGGGWRPGQGGGQRQTITCSSNDGRRNFCSVGGYNLNSVVLTRQISGSACVQNQTWGVDQRRGIWVDRGCRAEFQINR
jgi:hypothetical protein